MIAALFFVLASSVDRSKYRTCEQSKFCKRDRLVENQKWSLDPKSISTKPTMFEAKINDATFSSELKLKIFFLACGAARIRIEPLKKESFNRFDLAAEPTVVMQKELTSTLSFEIETSEKAAILKNKDQVLEIDFQPFKIVISDKSGKRMTVNPEDNAIFETGRDEKKWPELFESSSFGGHTDKFKNGPTSVAIDVEFHSEGVRMSGLPSHTLPVTLEQTVNVSDPIRLFNTDINSYEIDSTMSMYGAVPFVMTHSLNGCDGVFWCNPSETWADIVTNGTNKVRFMSEGGYIDLFICAGTAKDVVNTFTQITGRPQLIPYWALAYHQCRWGYMTANEVMDISKNYDNEIIPHDIMWLDLDHADDKKYFTWNPTNFKNANKLLDELEHNKRKLVTLVDPHLKVESSYSVYSEAMEKKLFIKNSDNSDFVGNCWPGKSSWPDYLNPETRAWWETNFRYDKYKNSRPNLHIWNDMNEIAVFDSCDLTAPRDLVHHGAIEEREVHNIYGAMMVSATFGGMIKRDKDENQRPFILTRSFFAGTQKYAAVWSGDNTADWKHLKNSIAVVITYGLSGQVYNGADVGGFFNSPNPKLLSHWFQVAAWLYPFFREHCHHLSDHREINLLKDEAKKVTIEALYARYKLLPYWYTLARNANLTGEPIVRPMWWEFSEEKFLDVDDRAMLGSALFVAPITSEDDSSMKVELPSGQRWYCFNTLSEITTPETEVKEDNGRVAVFLRGGSIIPSKRRIRKSSTLMFWDPFTLTIGVDQNNHAEGELYVDDGETFNFAKGHFIHKKFIFDGKKLTASDLHGHASNAFIDSYDVVIEQIKITGLTDTPKKITDKNGAELRFDMTDNVLTIHKPQVAVRDNFEVSFVY